jgi:hypothetical protein
MAIPREKVSYDSLGTISSPVTLTASYGGNRIVHLSKYMPNIHLDIEYIPLLGQTNRYVYILIEASNDDGTTWFPVSSRLISVDRIRVYDEDFDGNIGIPVIVPGDQTSTGGTKYYAFVDLEVVADKIRVSAKEDGAANFGTLYVRTTLTNEN